MAASTKAPTTTKGARVSILTRLWLQHLGALAVKIGPHPGMLGLKQLAHRSDGDDLAVRQGRDAIADGIEAGEVMGDHEQDRKSTRLNSSHGYISYAVFCLKKKKK